jgi:hypothetical protein
MQTRERIHQQIDEATDGELAGIEQFLTERRAASGRIRQRRSMSSR